MIADNWYNKKLESTYTFFTVKARKPIAGRPSGGFVFGFQNELTEVICIESNMNHITLLISNLNLYIFFVYIPPDQNHSEVLSTVFEKITLLCTRGKKVLVLGDLNGRIGELSTANSSRKSRDQTVNHRGKVLFNKIKESGLNIGNGCTLGDYNGCVTFISDSVAGSSVVDLLLYSTQTHTLIKTFKVLDFTHSDHFPILLTLNSTNPKTKFANPNPVLFSKRKILFPTDKNCIHKFYQTLDKRLDSLHPQMDINLIYNDLANSIADTCTELQLWKEPKPIISSPHWYDKNCLQLKKETKRNLRALRRNTDPTLKSLLESNYRAHNKIYNETIQQKAEAFKASTQDKLLNHKDSKSFWSAFKSLNYSVPANNNIKIDEWYNHFSRVFTIPTPYNPNPIALPTDFTPDPILDTEFNIFEMRVASKKLKAKKAAGIDLIPNEIWKHGSPKLLLLLCSIFQLCYNSGKVPLEWCEAVISPIYKKGNSSETTNYRPISLLNTVLKLFTSILNTRLNYWVKVNCKLSQFQAGFQKNKSCLDHAFVLNSVIQMQLLKNQRLYVCFIDLSQAFDTPDHNKLWKVLLDIGISPKFVRIFSFIYKMAHARVKTSDGLTDPIKIMKGVLQGESASPTIFNLFLEGIVNCISRQWIAGIRLLSITLHILLYADDMAILAPSKETLQQKISIVASFLAERGLNINLDKSKVVIFKRGGKIPKNEKFSWRGRSIQTVKSYKYLGIFFCNTGLHSLAANDSVEKGLSAVGATLSSLNKTKTFDLKTSLKLFESIIKSTALYGAGIWGLSKAEEIEKVQQQYFKRLLNLPTCTPRYFIRLELGLSHLSFEITKLTLTMFDRILKSPPHSLLYETFQCLKRISNTCYDPDPKYSWCLELRDKLVNLGFEKVWTRNSANYLCAFRDPILMKLRQNLGADDQLRAQSSSSIPHYSTIKSCLGPELYLMQLFPFYLVTCIAQTRLNFSLLYNTGKWHNLGFYEDAQCSFCGESESLLHLFNCQHYFDIKSKIWPLDQPSDILNIVQKPYKLNPCKNLYFFITSALKKRS